MKTVFLNTGCFLMILFSAISFNSYGKIINQQIGNNVPPQLNCSVKIPVDLQSTIVRQDFENESIFSLVNGKSAPVFLFSITKVTGDQWMILKNQLDHFVIIEKQDGYITYVQQTDVQKIAGDHNSQYQAAMQQLDGMISSIQLK